MEIKKTLLEKNKKTAFKPPEVKVDVIKKSKSIFSKIKSFASKKNK